MATSKPSKEMTRFEKEAKLHFEANAGKTTVNLNYAVPHGVFSQLSWVKEKIREVKIKLVDVEPNTFESEQLNLALRALSRIEPEFNRLEGEAAEFFLQQEVEDRIRQERIQAENPIGAQRYAEIRRKRFQEMQERMEKRNAEQATESGFNRYWFREQLATHNLTQRALALELNIDPAAVSYMLSGRRRVSMDEAKKMADLFGVNTTEVMRQAGVQVTEDAPLIPLRGFTKDGSKIEWLDSPQQKRVTAPYDASARDYVIQDRTGDRPSDGWLYYISGERLEPSNNLDRYVIMKLGSGEEIFGMVKKGYSAGQYNVLLGPELKKTLHEQTVDYVSPIMWIKPSNITWAPPALND